MINKSLIILTLGVLSLIILSLIILSLIIICYINEDYVTYNNLNYVISDSPLHNNLLLLTVYNTEDRENLYVDTIKWWIKNSSFDIYVVNSSGKYFNTSFDSNRIKIFTFNQNTFTEKGKSSTYYELLSIQKILESNPSILTDYTMILKLTGKYKLPGAENLVKQIPQHIDIIFQNQRNILYQNTELIGIKSDKIIDILKFCQNQDDIFERSMSKLKLKKFSTLRLPSINIPEKFRVKRGNDTVLKYL
jgi:hypothetical protein